MLTLEILLQTEFKIPTGYLFLMAPTMSLRIAILLAIRTTTGFREVGRMIFQENGNAFHALQAEDDHTVLIESNQLWKKDIHPLSLHKALIDSPYACGCNPTACNPSYMIKQLPDFAL